MQNERQKKHKILSQTVECSAGAKERLSTQKKDNDKMGMVPH